MRIPPLIINIMVEADPFKSRILEYIIMIVTIATYYYNLITFIVYVIVVIVIICCFAKPRRSGET